MRFVMWQHSCRHADACICVAAVQEGTGTSSAGEGFGFYRGYAYHPARSARVRATSIFMVTNPFFALHAAGMQNK